MSNPTCCDRAMAPHGTTKAGSQRYKCQLCKKTLTESLNTHGGHRKGIPGGMSKAEKQKAYRERVKQRRLSAQGEQESINNFVDTQGDIQ